MSERYKITALKNVTVSAYVCASGFGKIARDHQGNEIPTAPRMQHVQKRFELKAGDSREDIAMIVSVTEDDSFLPRRIEMPSTVGDEFQDGELLRVQRVA